MSKNFLLRSLHAVRKDINCISGVLGDGVCSVRVESIITLQRYEMVQNAVSDSNVRGGPNW